QVPLSEDLQAIRALALFPRPPPEYIDCFVPVATVFHLPREGEAVSTGIDVAHGCLSFFPLHCSGTPLGGALDQRVEYDWGALLPCPTGIRFGRGRQVVERCVRRKA